MAMTEMLPLTEPSGDRFDTNTFTTPNSSTEQTVSLGFTPKYVAIVQKTISPMQGLAVFENNEGSELESWMYNNIQRIRYNNTSHNNVTITLGTNCFKYTIVTPAQFGNCDAYWIAVG